MRTTTGLRAARAGGRAVNQNTARVASRPGTATAGHAERRAVSAATADSTGDSPRAHPSEYQHLRRGHRCRTLLISRAQLMRP
eukprot:1413071-Pleurochrysis_carterae.AAC.1